MLYTHTQIRKVDDSLMPGSMNIAGVVKEEMMNIVLHGKHEGKDLCFQIASGADSGAAPGSVLRCSGSM